MRTKEQVNSEVIVELGIPTTFERISLELLLDIRELLLEKREKPSIYIPNVYSDDGE